MDNFKVNRIDLKAETEKQLLLYIKSMDLEKNNKLPREEELATYVGVSRITLRGALAKLESQGLIFRRHGKGTFVNPLSQEIRISLSPALSFYYMIRQSGLTPRSEQVKVELMDATEEIANSLKIEIGAKVYRFDKMFYADNMPCAYIVDYVPQDIFKTHLTEEAFEEYKESIFKLLSEQADDVVLWDRIEIDTVLSSDLPMLNQFCRVDGSVSPILLLKGTNYNAKDEPIIFTYEYINTKIIKYSQIRKRESLYDFEA